tara:strand:- start:870 stop:1043 length:174 start_codon:yes stop_codon:yes gene_type:complete
MIITLYRIEIYTNKDIINIPGHLLFNGITGRVINLFYLPDVPVIIGESGYFDPLKVL